MTDDVIEVEEKEDQLPKVLSITLWVTFLIAFSYGLAFLLNFPLPYKYVWYVHTVYIGDGALSQNYHWRKAEPREVDGIHIENEKVIDAHSSLDNEWAKVYLDGTKKVYEVYDDKGTAPDEVDVDRLPDHKEK
jgi:hypothetical protein